MAGGKGTRIAEIRSDVPKPMIKVCGKPILEWQIEGLRNQGLKDITLVIGHLGTVIKEYFGDGSHFGVNISYFEETEPLGTAGALFKMSELVEDFLLMCGDVILNVDFNRFIDFHRRNNAWASLMAHPNGHPYDSSILVTEILPPQVSGGNPVDTHRVVSWMNKEDERHWYKNRVNAGIEILSPKLLCEVKKNFVPKHPEMPDRIDLDRDVLKPNIISGKIYAYDTPEYIKDMGIPDRYYEVEADIRYGKTKARNLSQKQKAFFLDRDGVINKHIGFLTNISQFELISGVAEAIRKINKFGYLAIVVTNQPVIARGDCSFEELQEIHNKMETLLGQEGAYIDGIYVCPHHPDKGFEGERAEYKCDCDCRKPKTGLIKQAIEDWNINVTESYFVGDSTIDYQCGENAHCKQSILIETNEPNGLLNAIKEIIDKKILYAK